ncbi:MAG: hypothetical protein WBY73_16220, partial [Candidatus Acidiferrales bacterium]
MKGVPFLLLFATAILAGQFVNVGARQSAQSAEPASLPAVKPGVVHFEDIAQRAGIRMQNFYGSDTHKEFIIETTGNG